MGSACCVASKGRKAILPNRNSTEGGPPWNARHSATWNCQLDDSQGEGIVEDEAENRLSRGSSGTFSLQTKGGIDDHGGRDLSGLNDFRIPLQQKSPREQGVAGDSATPASGLTQQ